MRRTYLDKSALRIGEYGSARLADFDHPLRRMRAYVSAGFLDPDVAAHLVRERHRPGRIAHCDVSTHGRTVDRAPGPFDHQLAGARITLHVPADSAQPDLAAAGGQLNRPVEFDNVDLAPLRPDEDGRHLWRHADLDPGLDPS